MIVIKMAETITVNKEVLTKYHQCSIIGCKNKLVNDDNGKWIKSSLSDIYEQYATFICNDCLYGKVPPIIPVNSPLDPSSRLLDETV